MYDLKVCEKNGKLVYVVYISCPIKAGILFFNSVDEMFSWAEEESKRFARFGFEFEHGELDWNEVRTIVNEVLNDERLHIGENGRTYYE